MRQHIVTRRRRQRLRKRLQLKVPNDQDEHNAQLEDTQLATLENTFQQAFVYQVARGSILQLTQHPRCPAPKGSVGPACGLNFVSSPEALDVSHLSGLKTPLSSLSHDGSLSLPSRELWLRLLSSTTKAFSRKSGPLVIC